MGRRERTKRVLDVLGSGAVLAASGPALIASAVAIRLSLGRPVFFFQERAGKDGRPFRIIKFRTMRPPAEGEDEVGGDELRTPPVGRFLRSTSLDELPTLLNVLKGDMSLVGPRPLLIRYLDRYSAEQARRHEVKPGITGWAQVHGRNAISWEDRFKLDVWYVDNRSTLLDLKTLAKTVAKVVVRDGIQAEDGGAMPEFMGSE